MIRKIKILIILTILLLTLGLPSGVYAYYHTTTGSKTSEVSISMSVNPTSPSTSDVIEISFPVKDSSGNLVAHIDYEIKIILNGETIFQRELHDHEGDIKLIFKPGSGSISVSGSPDNGGVYTIKGSVFSSAGEYTLVASVVGIEFSPINPVSKEFTLSVSQGTQPSGEEAEAGGEEAGGFSINITILGVVIVLIIVIVALVFVRRRV